MAINLGNPNSSRYYLVSDSSDLTLPNGDWGIAALVRPTLASTTFPKYLFSTNALGVANSLNVFIGGGDGKFAAQYNATSIWPDPVALSAGSDYIVYVIRLGTQMFVGHSLLGSGSVSDSGGLDIPGSSSNGGNWYIGARTDLNTDRFWRGHIEWLAFSNNAAFRATDIIDISNGAPVMQVIGNRLTRLWHWQTATSTERDLITGQTATRNGTGWADAEDRSVIYLNDGWTWSDITPQTILIDAVPGEISITPLAANVSVGINIDAIPGEIAITGQTANIIQSHHIDATPDEIVISGIQGHVSQSLILNATPGQIDITGQQSQVSIAMLINAVAAGITIEGLQAVIPEGILISAEPGGIQVSGVQAQVILGTTINATPAELSIAGLSGDVIQGITIDATPADISIDGVVANVEIAMLINAQTAEMSITGAQASISIGGEPIIINTIAGSITLDAQTAEVIAGSLVITPQSRIIAAQKANRIIGIKSDNRIIGVTKGGRYVN